MDSMCFYFTDDEILFGRLDDLELTTSDIQGFFHIAYSDVT